MICNFETYEEFEGFVKSHSEVKSRTEFKKKFPHVYGKFIWLRQVGKITKELPIESKRKNYNMNLGYKTLEDFQKYVNDNKITSGPEFLKLNPSLYYRGSRLKLIHKLTYYGKINYSLFNKTLINVQKFIYDNNITSKTDLKRRFVTVYRKYVRLRDETGDDVKFCDINVDSSNESMFLSELIKNKIYMKTQVHLKDSNGNDYRYDFLNKEHKVIVEVHGVQHFDPAKSYEIWKIERDDEGIDKIKNSIAKSQGYTILYFTYDKTCYESFGYFDTVFTDINEIINILKKLIPEEYDYELNDELEKAKYNDLEYITEEDSTDLHISPLEIQSVEDLLNVINEYKIKTPTDLINMFPRLYAKAEKLKWVRKLYYYRENNELGDMKNYRTASDVNNFIKTVGIKSKQKLRKSYYSLYNKCWRNNWLDSLEYVK